ncbi:MAG: hypothetical protein H6576_06170 [Lewinellaceae bacterium]|nr:hypothetical protein [Saprospiraceae bacterium]MCB9343261.1 hypothetical protein [Lewinellaceae bacterium]
MKRSLLLTVLFVVLGIGAWFALNHKNQKGSRISWDMDFAVRNTDDIGKIFIADRKGRTALLERKEGGWIYNGKYNARPTAVQILLSTISKINVLNIPPAQAVDPMVKKIAGTGIKVEIYDKKNKPMKVYYVGGITNDEQGTIMMMEGSEQPYVMHIPSFVGSLRVRYLLGDDEWRDRSVFCEKPENIEEITVQYPQEKSESFKLEKTGNATYEVQPFYSTTPPSKSPQRKGVAEGYLLQFESLAAEAFETTNTNRDSVVQLVPFAIINLKKTDGSERSVKFWPTATDFVPETGKPYVVRYFTEVNQEDFLLTQHRVFAPIFRGYSYFFE